MIHSPATPPFGAQLAKNYDNEGRRGGTNTLSSTETPTTMPRRRPRISKNHPNNYNKDEGSPTNRSLNFSPEPLLSDSVVSTHNTTGITTSSNHHHHHHTNYMKRGFLTTIINKVVAPSQTQNQSAPPIAGDTSSSICNSNNCNNDAAAAAPAAPQHPLIAPKERPPQQQQPTGPPPPPPGPPSTHAHPPRTHPPATAQQSAAPTMTRACHRADQPAAPEILPEFGRELLEELAVSNTPETISIGAWNIGGQSKKGGEIARIMEKKNLDILFLQETKERNSSGLDELSTLFNLKCHSRLARQPSARNACGGMAVLTNNSDQWEATPFSPNETEHEDIMWVRIQHLATNTALFVACVYGGWGTGLPGTVNEYREALRDHLNQDILALSAEHGLGDNITPPLLVMGDMNTRQDLLDASLAARGIEKSRYPNRRTWWNACTDSLRTSHATQSVKDSRQWRAVMDTWDLCVANGRAPTSGGPNTRTSPAANTKDSELDLILVTKQQLPSVRHCTINATAAEMIGTDHALVHIEWQWPRAPHPNDGADGMGPPDNSTLAMPSIDVKKATGKHWLNFGQILGKNISKLCSAAGNHASTTDDPHPPSPQAQADKLWATVIQILTTSATASLPLSSMDGRTETKKNNNNHRPSTKNHKEWKERVDCARSKKRSKEALKRDPHNEAALSTLYKAVSALRISSARIAITDQKRTKEMLDTIADKFADDANHSEAWKLLKKRCGASKKQLPKRMIEAGRGAHEAEVLTATREETCANWQRHGSHIVTPEPLDSPLFDLEHALAVNNRYKEICAAEKLYKNMGILPPGTVDRQSSSPITLTEITDAIQWTQNNKAPGLDGISNKIIKNGGPNMALFIHTLILALQKLETAPNDWRTAVQAPIYKGKGKLTDCGNYRLITLLSAMAKIYEIVLNKRIAVILTSKQLIDINQGGFQSKKGTLTCLYIFTELIKARHRAGKPGAPQHPVGPGGPTYCLFIDFKKAFPSVYKEGLWTTLHDAGIKGKLWRILHDLLTGTSSRIRDGDLISQAYTAINGVREGSVLSPTLFLIFINGLLTTLRKLGLGAYWGSQWLGLLLYADDAVLIANSWIDLQIMFNEVSNYCRKWRLTLNRGKTKTMVLGERPSVRKQRLAAAPKAGIVMGTQQLEEVDQYQYLGVWLMHNLQATHHINLTKIKALTAGHNIKVMGVAQDRLPPWLARTILESLLSTKIEYGMSIWGTHGDKDILALSRCQRVALEHLTGQYHIPDTKSCLEAECGIDYVETRIIGDLWILMRMLKNTSPWHPVVNAIHTHNLGSQQTLEMGPVPHNMQRWITAEDKAAAHAARLDLHSIWHQFTSTPATQHSKDAHRRLGLQLKIANNVLIYEAKISKTYGGHRLLSAPSRHWTMAPYLRYKTSQYPIAALTAIRLSSSSLHRDDTGCPAITSSGQSRTTLCHHCSQPWGMEGVNAHILLHCSSFGEIRTRRLSAIIPKWYAILSMTNPERDTARQPLTNDELLHITMGDSPDGMGDAPDGRSALLGVKEETAAQATTRKTITEKHQEIIQLTSRMVRAMENAARNLRRQR